MEAILTAAQMSKADDATINYFRVPSEVLMERAALSVVDAIEREGYNTEEVLVVCGSGNNGGDGFAVARLLTEKEIFTRILYTGKGDFSSLSPGARLQKEICYKYEIPVLFSEDFDWDEDNSTLIIDAMFGIGLNRPLNADKAHIAERINEAREEGAYVVSVDIPSGIAADTGKILGAAVRADMTVTFGFKKLGQLLYPGSEYTGKLVCAQIGITKRSFLNTKPEYTAIEPSDLPCVHRKDYSNKGTYGKLLIIAGSEGAGGCALLAARAAFGTGVGMVRVYTHSANRELILNNCPETIVDTYSSEPSEEKLMKAAEWADVIAIGPGIGKDRSASGMLRLLLYRCEKPLVIDADAIMPLREYEEYLSQNYTRDIIITPHIMEMARFMDIERSIVLDDIIHVAKNVSERLNLVCVLKDARTVITRPSFGCRVNTSGNNGMAVAGMGDVLFGIIAGLLSQGMNAFDAASFGAFIHGYAADKAVIHTGKSGLLARDVIGYLKECFE
ncbi:MAG TPA: bifunctional ADP-dependent NAD(P)H-hydrate dehydratase/NAD(P)H-hydrate epimerase [Lachnospiraceae bacterium]|nr:bifunctional ADP-dependent NAD(P)H-hydrate dehydratase/NAD(P)H-hydrate epimerase [Lachnospiraceae bacterium]